MNGGRQICFTDSKGKALFSIPDGGIIRLFYGNGEDGFALCRYLDETHARIDGVDSKAACQSRNGGVAEIACKKFMTIRGQSRYGLSSLFTYCSYCKTISIMLSFR